MVTKAELRQQWAMAARNRGGPNQPPQDIDVNFIVNGKALKVRSAQSIHILVLLSMLPQLHPLLS